MKNEEIFIPGLRDAVSGIVKQTLQDGEACYSTIQAIVADCVRDETKQPSFAEEIQTIVEDIIGDKHFLRQLIQESVSQIIHEYIQGQDFKSVVSKLLSDIKFSISVKEENE